MSVGKVSHLTRYNLYPIISRHGPDNGTKPGGERHRREAPSQAKFGYGEREALPQVRCAGKFQARSAPTGEIWTWGARSAPARVLCGRISGAKRRTNTWSEKRSHRRNLDVGSAQRSRMCVVRKNFTNFRREAPNTWNAKRSHRLFEQEVRRTAPTSFLSKNSGKQLPQATY